MSLTIWIDADAAPRAVKETCFQVALRRELRVLVVANQRQAVPESPLIEMVRVGSGFDAADGRQSFDAPIEIENVERHAILDPFSVGRKRQLRENVPDVGRFKVRIVVVP